jgi:molybdate transport system permease protein
MISARAFRVALVIALALVLAFLALPIAALFVHQSPAQLAASLGDEAAVDALSLSLRTSVTALVVIVLVGTPAAYLLATRRFPGRALALTLVELPIVLPPAAAGIALLAAFGPHGLLGGAISGAGIQLVLETAGVVVALTFVSAPFYVRGAAAAFAAVDPELFEASRTLGSGPAATFARVAIPQAAGGLVAALALAWARALGEFGATLLFAGSVRGVTQTAPLAIFAFLSTDFDAAVALSAVLLAMSAAILLAVKLLASTAVSGVTAPSR